MAGKNSPTPANHSAARTVKPAVSSATGAHRTNRTVAAGTLIAAPERASSVRRPIRPVTRATPKHSELSNAKASAVAISGA
jgi:hypothetical protein